MNAQGMLTLYEFYRHIDVFLLIIVRLLAFFIILPILSGTDFPNVTKIAMAFVAACLIFISGKAASVEYTASAAGYIYLVLQEFIAGFTMGYAVYFVFTLIYFAGQLMDYQIGFSMVSVFDPLTQIQVPILGNLLFFAVGAILVETGGLNAFLSAVFFSYDVLPIGKAVIFGNAGLAWELLNMLGGFLIVAVRISLPIVGSIFILDVAMGLLVKAVPQMNVFVVGVPIKVLVGLALLLVLMPIVNTLYGFVFEDSYNALMSVLRGLSP